MPGRRGAEMGDWRNISEFASCSRQLLGESRSAPLHDATVTPSRAERQMDTVATPLFPKLIHLLDTFSGASVTEFSC